MSTSASIVLSVFSLLAIVLLVPAFLWHAKYSKSIPVLFLISWLTYVNLIAFINSIIWGGDHFDNVWDGKIYCDITTRLDAGSFLGKESALSAISLNLLMILKGNSTFIARDGPLYRRKVMINVLICGVTPVLVMILQYFVATQRYMIVRYEGCGSPYASTPAVIGIYSIWSFLWTIVSLVLAMLTLYEYYQKKKDVRDLLRCSNSGLSFKKFVKILIYSVITLIVITPVSIYNFATDIQTFAGPYSVPYNWSEIHSDEWQYIYYVDAGYSLVVRQWVNIGLSIITFVLFGAGSEAMVVYKAGLRRLMGKEGKIGAEGDEEDYIEGQSYRLSTLSKNSTGRTLGQSGDLSKKVLEICKLCWKEQILCKTSIMNIKELSMTW